MSTSYIHCAIPSSLPSDYAAIHRHAAANANAEGTFHAETDNVNGEASSEPIRPQKPTMAKSDPNKLPAWAAGPTERTPLITPVPRIEETVDGEDMDQSSLAHQYWEETKILVKYTLPVVG